MSVKADCLLSERLLSIQPVYARASMSVICLVPDVLYRSNLAQYLIAVVIVNITDERSDSSCTDMSHTHEYQQSSLFASTCQKYYLRSVSLHHSSKEVTQL